MSRIGKRVVIIGTGISGLACAFWLDRMGFDVTVLEAEKRVGGSIETVKEDGFLIEMGPTSALETTPLIGKILEELGIKNEMIYANEVSNKRYVLRDGELHEVPMTPLAFIKSGLISPAGKVRMLREFFIKPPSDADETLASFVRRRFGQEFLMYVINPFVAGVYAGDPENLSVRAAFPKLFELERRYGSVLRGAIAGKKERKARAKERDVSKQTARLFSFRSGLSTLTETISGSLGSRIHLKSPVVDIMEKSRDGGAYQVIFKQQDVRSSVDADAVIVSIPAYAAVPLIDSFDEEIGKRLAGVSYPPVSMVFLGYSAGGIKRPLDGFGFLVPEVEKRSILGTIWSSTIFPERAPEGHVALTTFVGGARQPEEAERDRQELIEMVSSELRTLGLVNSSPVFHAVRTWERSIPQYVPGYPKFLQSLERFEKAHRGIFFCANFKGGISLADCIKSADNMTARISEYLQKQ